MIAGVIKGKILYKMVKESLSFYNKEPRDKFVSVFFGSTIRFESSKITKGLRESLLVETPNRYEIHKAGLLALPDLEDLGRWLSSEKHQRIEIFISSDNNHLLFCNSKDIQKKFGISLPFCGKGFIKSIKSCFVIYNLNLHSSRHCNSLELKTSERPEWVHESQWKNFIKGMDIILLINNNSLNAYKINNKTPICKGIRKINK